MTTLIGSSINLLRLGLPAYCETRQEILRGATEEGVLPALIGRISYYVALLGGQYFQTELRNGIYYDRLIIGLGLAWAAASYKGLSERSWMGEFMAIAALPTVNKIIDSVVGPRYTDRLNRIHYLTTGREPTKFVLKTAALMVQAAALYYLQGMRNPSLSVRPYLYYGAGVILLTRLNKRYDSAYLPVHAHWLVKNVILPTVIKLGIGLLVARGVQMYTGETLLISRKWEILENLGPALAAGAFKLLH